MTELFLTVELTQKNSELLINCNDYNNIQDLTNNLNFQS